MLTLDEACERLDLSRHTVRTLARKRNLGTKTAKGYMFSEEDIRSMTKRRPVGRPRKTEKSRWWERLLSAINSNGKKP